MVAIVPVKSSSGAAAATVGDRHRRCDPGLAGTQGRSSTIGIASTPRKARRPGPRVRSRAPAATSLVTHRTLATVHRVSCTIRGGPRASISLTGSPRPRSRARVVWSIDLHAPPLRRVVYGASQARCALTPSVFAAHFAQREAFLPAAVGRGHLAHAHDISAIWFAQPRVARMQERLAVALGSVDHAVAHPKHLEANLRDRRSRLLVTSRRSTS